MLGLHWPSVLLCSSCGNCCTISLEPMLICGMLKLELKMDNTSFLLGKSYLQGKIFLHSLFLTNFF